MDWVSGFPDEELRGVGFARREYRSYSTSWWHDHCAVCGVGLSESFPSDEHQGFATTAAFPQGSEYVWVCENCFAAESEAMGWHEVKAADDLRPQGLEVMESGGPKIPRLHDPT